MLQRFLVALLPILALLAACGGESSADPFYQAVPKVCDIVSKQVISPYVGDVMGKRTDFVAKYVDKEGGVTADECSWDHTQEVRSGDRLLRTYSRRLTVVIVRYPEKDDYGYTGAQMAKNEYESTKKAARDTNALIREEPGLGQGAFLQTMGSADIWLRYRRGNLIVRVMFNIFDSTDPNVAKSENRQLLQSGVLAVAREVDAKLASSR
ncbi:hypothetical protein TH66_15210 [Carbonactinospora thermoautotrophica]|uniref:Lipoprotein n=2 Tax=Carbonactinospora thermoautotrophica TaxID=1469144 RepID=A0A132N7H9_9ACTN|nr:hypothetical protein TH66_15210 [Carbonactinospora thermoautotrophica]KWX06115.1 hypothetical protein TR74_22990 [Carbonactinospora thermoautotrophica]